MDILWNKLVRKTLNLTHSCFPFFFSLLMKVCTDFYPCGTTAFGIVSTLVCAAWTDHTRVRWPVLVYMALALILSSICLLIWSSPTALKFFAYCGFSLSHSRTHLRTCNLHTHTTSTDLAGASYAGQATTFAQVYIIRMTSTSRIS